MKIHTGQMNAIIFPDTGKHQAYRHLMKEPNDPKWTRAFENEIGRFFQEIRDIEETKTCFFIYNNELIHVGIQLFTTFGKTDLIKDKGRTTYDQQTI